jgi:NAD(P)-dependent dehydrogenase (short-subunit alcohol dehydrogenase family)
VDPRSAHPRISPPEQIQNEPGSDRDLEPQADRGEDLHQGLGRLQGRKALITGADSGIGAAVALAFAREGAQVALAHLPQEAEDASDIKDIIESDGGTVHLLPGDLTDREYCRDLVPHAAELLGSLDILVNNAGRQISIDDISQLEDDQVEQTFHANILAMFTLCREATAHMEPGGCIINTTSIQAYSPSAHLLDYASTKAAINNFSKGLAQQLGPKGIRVNAVAPGPIWTPLQPSHGQPREALPAFGKNTWLGRAGQPVEVAPAYVFLASDEASYVTGSTIHVNGGQTSP